MPVDRDFVIKNKTVNPDDNVLPELRFELPQRPLMKNDLAILNIIAANNWKRPICFTSPFDGLDFDRNNPSNPLNLQNYLRKDGMSFRLVPVKPDESPDKWVINLYRNTDNT